jgi:type IV pilus secretin PilQ/predicted competence protein
MIIYKMIRYALVALAALAVLGAAGCGPSARRPVSAPGPAGRTPGARVLEADPDLESRLAAAAARAVPAAPAPAPPPGPARTDAPPSDLAVGVTVSLDLVDARAVDAVRALAYQGNVDVVLASGADRRVTVHLKDTPWMEAFQSVLAGANLVALWDGRRARVLTPEQLRQERETAAGLERQQTATEVVRLQNLLAADAAKTLAPVLSEGGQIGIDEETNTLIIRDRPSRIPAIRAAFRELDRVPPQVMIEALIVDVTLSDELHYGVDWTVSRTGKNVVDILQALTVGAGTDPVLGPGGSLGFTLASGDWSIEGLYDALQVHDNIKVLANPKVLAINNRRATIEIVEEIPYQVLTQTGAGGQIGTTDFKQVGIKLGVTPRVAADGTVHLILAAEQSASTTAAVNEIPVIQTRRAESIMTVGDGQLIVLGGLRRHRTTTQERKIPVLGDLKIIGHMFRRDETADIETELVVFIRPRVIPPGDPLTARERTLAGAVDRIEVRPHLERSDPLRLHVEEEQERRRRIP